MHTQAQQPHHLSCCWEETGTALSWSVTGGVGWVNKVHVPMPAHAQQPHHLSCCRALTRTALSMISYPWGPTPPTPTPPPQPNPKWLVPSINVRGWPLFVRGWRGFSVRGWLVCNVRRWLAFNVRRWRVDLSILLAFSLQSSASRKHHIFIDAFLCFPRASFIAACMFTSPSDSHEHVAAMAHNLLDTATANYGGKSWSLRALDSPTSVSKTEETIEGPLSLPDFVASVCRKVAGMVRCSDVCSWLGPLNQVVDAVANNDALPESIRPPRDLPASLQETSQNERKMGVAKAVLCQTGLAQGSLHWPPYQDQRRHTDHWSRVAFPQGAHHFEPERDCRFTTAACQDQKCPVRVLAQEQWSLACLRFSLFLAYGQNSSIAGQDDSAGDVQL